MRSLRTMRRLLAAALYLLPLCTLLGQWVTPVLADEPVTDAAVQPPTPTPTPTDESNASAIPTSEPQASATPVDVAPAEPAPTAPPPFVTPPLTPPVTAAPRGPRRPPQPHSGVMWRVHLGGAYMHGWSTSAGMSRTVSAFPGLAISVSMGHSIGERIVLHMDLDFARSGSATYSSEGETIVDDVSLSSVLIGGGVTYWVPDYDVFITGSFGLAQMSTVSGTYRLVVELPDIESTRVGVGVRAAIGKHWRLGHKWGLGPAFQLTYLSAPQEFGDADHLKLLMATLSVSATYD